MSPLQSNKMCPSSIAISTYSPREPGNRIGTARGPPFELRGQTEPKAQREDRVGLALYERVHEKGCGPVDRQRERRWQIRRRGRIPEKPLKRLVTHTPKRAKPRSASSNSMRDAGSTGAGEGLSIRENLPERRVHQRLEQGFDRDARVEDVEIDQRNELLLGIGPVACRERAAPGKTADRER